MTTWLTAMTFLPLEWHLPVPAATGAAPAAVRAAASVRIGISLRMSPKLCQAWRERKCRPGGLGPLRPLAPLVNCATDAHLRRTHDVQRLALPPRAARQLGRP